MRYVKVKTNLEDCIAELFPLSRVESVDLKINGDKVWFIDYSRGYVPAVNGKYFDSIVDDKRRAKWSIEIEPDDDPLFRKRYVCSACGGWNGYGMTHYCPNCGAEMGKE